MGEQASPSATGKRKFVRMGSGPRSHVTDMGALGAFAALKSEADNIWRAGVAHVLQKVEHLTPLLHNYLSGSAARDHSDEIGREFEGKNMRVYHNLRHADTTVAYDDSPTGTCAVEMDKEVSLNVYIQLVQALKTGTDDSDGVPKFHLDSVGGTSDAKKMGGFQKLYNSVNVPAVLMKKPEQDRCIFGMSHSHFFKVTGSNGKRLFELVSAQVADMYKVQSVTCKAIHVLFHWNTHSFFTYHCDEDGDVSAIVNLSHGKSSMHVSGCEVAVYDGIGSTHIFPTNVYHRSGAAPRRCVKVAFFFSVPSGKKVPFVNNEAGSSSSNAVLVAPAPEPALAPEPAPAPAPAFRQSDTPASGTSNIDISSPDEPTSSPKQNTEVAETNALADDVAVEDEPPAAKQTGDVPAAPAKESEEAKVAETSSASPGKDSSTPRRQASANQRPKRLGGKY